jgi:probable HAF family extracellular repeat protein
VRLLALLAAFAAAPAWTVTNLGGVPGDPYAFVQAVDVNASGAAVAIGSDGADRQMAFVWQKGKKTSLTYRHARWIQPSEINASGDVLGTAGAAGTTSVLWRKGVPTTFGSFDPAGMNRAGTLLVGGRPVNGRAHAAEWRRGVVTDLPDLGGRASYAGAVNDEGTIVGYSATPAGVNHAVAWHHAALTDLGSVNGLNTEATMVASDGTIVGIANTDQGGSEIVLVWKHRRLVASGSFGAGQARPLAVNAHGDVLIQTETTGIDPDIVGLRLLHDGQLIRISVPMLRGEKLWGVGLDDQGDVVGYGATTLRGFVWRNGRARLLPYSPTAVAGGWILASTGGGRAVLIRERS